MDKSLIRRKINALRKSGFFSRLELVQILKVIAGHKLGARLLFSGKEKTEQIGRALAGQEIPFAVRESETFAGKKDRGKGGWSNLCSSRSRVKNYALYIGLDDHSVKQALEAEEKQDDSLFGATLSYPDCCNRFFNAEFAEACEIQGDLFPFVFENTPRKHEELPFLLNPLWYFDSGFIEYWPCSFRCPDALRDARETCSLLHEYLPDIAREMKQILKNPVVYTEYSGIFAFPGSRYVEKEKTLFYSAEKIIKTAETGLFRYLSRGNRLILKDNSCLICNGNTLVHKVRNEKFCLARFTGEAKKTTGAEDVLAKIRTLRIDVPRTTMIEALMLMAGEKRSLRLVVRPADLEKAKKLAEILGVSCYVSPLRVFVVTNSATGDRYIDYRETSDPEADFLICYGRTRADAKECARLEASGNDGSRNALNEFLNYPACCVESFKIRKPHADWIRPFLRRTPITTWYPCCTNRLGYLFSGEMLLYDYEPCSAFCSGSLRLGKKIRDTFMEMGLAEQWKDMVDSVSAPVLLTDGLLVKVNNCLISSPEHGGATTLRYRTGDFEIQDYKLKPCVEQSPLWDSDKMVLRGKKIRIYKGRQLLGELTQSQYNNRIFLFKEIYDETEM